jgi:hypothetical protein
MDGGNLILTLNNWSRQMQKYNGWANYATWRINLEFFADYPEEFAGFKHAELKEHVEEVLAMDCDAASTTYSYALAFLDDVDWYEIQTVLNSEEVA